MINVISGKEGLDLNEVYNLNTVFGLGILVQFMIYIATSYTRQRGTSQEKSMKAMFEYGTIVLQAVAMTKIVGLFGLVFSSNTFLSIYYIESYLIYVFLGVFDGLFLLPTMLQLIGPSSVSI
jgi:membrane-associated HD superfamily phosphohydrolase